MVPKILLDTNIFKFAAKGPLCFIPANRKTRNWYGRVTGFQFYDIGYVNRNEKIGNPDLKREVDLLPQIAEIAKEGEFELLAHPETTYESWGLPAMGSPTGPFYGAPITKAESPIKYGRTIFAPGISADELTKTFLTGIRDARFQTLAKLTGGYQGSKQPNLNQLLDAFYIWCAEHSKCQYLLTLDFKLIRVVRNSKRQNLTVRLVKPSELLEETGHAVMKEPFLIKIVSTVKRLLGNHGGVRRLR